MKHVLSKGQLQEILHCLYRNNSFVYMNHASLSERYFQEAEKSLHDGFLYILLSRTKSASSEVIGLFTNKQYNHVSLCFDRAFHTIISYNGGNDQNQPGLNQETMEQLTRNVGSDVLLYRLPATYEQKKRIFEKVHTINQEGNSYNLIGLLLKFSFRPNIMFCSKFVYSMLTVAGLNYFNKKATHVKPTDFIELDYCRALQFIDNIEIDNLSSFMKKETKITPPLSQRLSKCECLDLLEVFHMERIYPLIFCHMHFESSIDLEQLEHAIQQSSLYVPEILSSYDLATGCFNKTTFATSDIFLRDTGVSGNWKWDLTKEPQVKVYHQQAKTGTDLTIGISHILCDGRGFLQYLHLLASLYSNRTISPTLKNTRTLPPVLHKIHVQQRTQQAKALHKMTMQPLVFPCIGDTPYCLCVYIHGKDLEHIKEMSSRFQVTLNDVFLSAYAYVLSKIQHTSIVHIPCPADLRPSLEQTKTLTIGNFTGCYRDLYLKINPQDSFTSIVQQAHIEMSLQKARYRCFQGIPFFHTLYGFIPYPVAKKLCRAAYHLSPISYTNFGKISSQKLTFGDTPPETCFLTGTYRSAPDFQLSISTYQDQCTLNCTVLGDMERRNRCQAILETVREVLVNWGRE